jgi:hypothetical protein
MIITATVAKLDAPSLLLRNGQAAICVAKYLVYLCVRRICAAIAAGNSSWRSTSLARDKSFRSDND